ncbi:MAG: mucoidy inhibitor MuiA family protein [Planctomycetota bacterium]|jgi:hypothetical protein
MKKRILIAALQFFIFVQPCVAEKTVPEVVGSISNVIVYRGQALVTRNIELDLHEGGSELIVKKLPGKIVSESLYAQASDDVTIASVRYRERAVKEDTREEVKQLDAEIEQVQTHLRHAEANKRLISENLNTLLRLQDFVVAAQSSDLNRGVLQFEPLEKLVGHIETKRGEYHGETLKVDDEIIELKKQMELLQRKRKELQAGRSRTEREAVLFVNNPNRKKPTIQLSYLVNEANWLPQHNLRANPVQGKVLVEYNALIHQASGEDWDGVAMSLSTAKPTMVAAPPSLEPMEVKLSSSAPAARRVRVDKESAKGLSPGIAYEQVQYHDLSDEYRRIQSSRREMARKGKAAGYALNVAAMDNQLMELRVEADDLQMIQEEAKRFARSEGISVTYNLGKGFTMPSRSDQQLITIAAFQTSGDFTMLGTPLLTDYVYLQADIVNDSDFILLAGSANMYRNGEFVGKGQLEMVTIGEKFTVGFGVDSQIQISREFKDKKIDTIWGNRVEVYDYRIAIENYKNSSVKLRLLERIPYTEDEELVIEGFKTNIPLSNDKEYLRTGKDKGLLRWDLNLSPATTEQKATVVTYSYTTKYDNDMHIQSVPVRR